MKKAQDLINRLREITEQAARRGERSCLVMWGLSNFSTYGDPHFTGLRGLFDPTGISPKVLPPDGKRVYDYCKAQGFRTRIEYSAPSFDGTRKGFFNLYIEW